MKRKQKSLYSWEWFCILACGVSLITACSTATNENNTATTSSVTNSAAVEFASARNLPADNKIALFMGQDSETLTEYRKEALEKDVSLPKPAGITLYTKISNSAKQGSLAGITKDTDYGAGMINFSKSLKEFPDAALAVGLDITDGHAGCKQIPTRAIAGVLGEGVTEKDVEDYRAQVDKLLVFLKESERDVFLRIGYEFDGPWNCYEPESYKAAYRFIKARINELNAVNIATVWQSAAWPRNQGIYQATDANHLEKFYPGNDVVDWVSLSTFYGDSYRDYQWTCDALSPEWFTPVVTPRSQQDRILAFARNHKKPVMIAEAAPVGFSNSQLTTGCIFTNRTKPIAAEEIWNSWYADWFDYIRANSDVIRAVAYINTNWHSQGMWYCAPNSTAGAKDCNQGYWADSRVQANPYILKKFKEEISKPVYVNGK
ncbi:hypothetical protein [Cellvibrio sp. NN19]|uniref:hypothetical protein n=1 Tax=Cellvibrio chitinivorans TaxID=3102792 RepID=UPI002B411D4B|nr:hypothetical protein [Cellvibrio sp. NN19]